MRNLYNPHEDKICAILDFLKLCGIFAWRNPTGATVIHGEFILDKGKIGGPDILGCLPRGIMIAIWCKAEKDRLSASQRKFLKSIKKMGGVTIVAMEIRDVNFALKMAGYFSNLKKLCESGLVP